MSFVGAVGRRLAAGLLVLLTTATVFVGVGAGPAQADFISATVPAGITPSNLAVNPATNKIYVPNKNSQTVSVINGTTNKPHVLITQPKPETAVVNSTTNKIYVGHSDGYVTVIDGATDTFTTIQTGGSSARLVLNEVTNQIYLPDGQGIVVIDGASNAISRITVSPFVRSLAVNSQTNQIYADSLGTNLFIIDVKTGLQTVIKFDDSIDKITVNQRDNKAYVTSSSGYSSGKVTIIDGTTNTSVALPLSSPPEQVIINDVTNQVYIVHATYPMASLTRLNGATNAIQSFPLSINPTYLAINRATNKIYISGHVGFPYIDVLDAATMSSGRIKTEYGTNPGAIAINEKTNKIYISNYERVDVIDGRNVAPTIISSAPPSKGRVASYFEHQFAANGSLTPKFRVSEGTLPAGLTLNETGLLSGIPTAAGTSYFKVTATNGTVPDAVTPTFGVTVKNRDIRHDYTGDGRTDVLARDGSGGLWLYPGNGYGGWLPRVQVGQGWNVMTAIISPGDFSGDGKADLLARDGSGTMWLYKGNGQGGWLPGVRVGQGWNEMSEITAIGDFNLDGNPDIFARTDWGSLVQYWGNGNSGWLGQNHFSFWWNSANSLTGAGDFDKDGFEDLMARDASGALNLFEGGRHSVFDQSNHINGLAVGYGWNAMTAIVGPGDFNGDGNVDLLARDAGGALWLYPSNGQGGWLPRGLVGSGWNAMNLII